MSYASLDHDAKRGHMRELITRYFDACNAADADAIAGCFVPGGTHYFPPGMYGGAWRGGRLIGERWADSVAARGSAWTIDRIVCEPESGQASSNGRTSRPGKAPCCAATSGTCSTRRPA